MIIILMWCRKETNTSKSLNEEEFLKSLYQESENKFVLLTDTICPVLLQEHRT